MVVRADPIDRCSVGKSLEVYHGAIRHRWHQHLVEDVNRSGAGAYADDQGLSARRGDALRLDKGGLVEKVVENPTLYG